MFATVTRGVWTGVWWLILAMAVLAMSAQVAAAQSPGESPGGPESEEVEQAPKSRAWLGVVLQDTRHRGSRIIGLYPNGPAARAGLRVGDFILRIGRNGVETSEDSIAAINQQPPHEQAEVVVLRRGRERRFRVTFGSRSEYEDAAQQVREASQCRRIGLPPTAFYGPQSAYYCPPGSGYAPGHYYYYQWGPLYRWYYYPTPGVRVPLGLPSVFY